MNSALVLVLLGCAIVAAAIIAKRIAIPYPVAFVVGGIALAFVPNVPRTRVDPNLIFLLVLPPLLHAGGWYTDVAEFKRNLRPISLLAIGLVLFSTVIVAVIAHAMMGLVWPMVFTLGAIVSPPDAVAAESIFERLAVPRRVAAILSGEGLLNDATALVVYRFAVIAALTGSFSLAGAVGAFPVVVVGGIGVGLVAGIAVEAFIRLLSRGRLTDATLTNVVILLAPYAAYLPADALNVSGVLATVTTGIYLNQRVARIMGSEARIVGLAVWQIMIFLLNAFVFVLIGIELRDIVASLGANIGHFAVDGAIVSLAVILVRLAWVYPATWLPRVLFGHLRVNDPVPSWRWVTVIAWSGMRGIVSLAAALALPYTNASGAPLDGRADIIFITLCVIVATLVFQGLTLAPLIRLLGVGEANDGRSQENAVRIRALEAAVRRLQESEPSFSGAADWEIAGRLLAEYQARIEHLRGHLAASAEKQARQRRETDHRLQRAMLQAERDEIAHLRRAGEIPDDVFRAIAYDLDLADLRIR